MKADVYRAAVKGDASIIESLNGGNDNENQSEDLQSVTSENNNIIHIAAKHGHQNFIREALKNKNLSTTKLINQRNIDGDIPLHVAVRHGHESAAKLLALINPGCLVTAQNKDGDTPLHVAFKYSRMCLARSLSHSPEPLAVLNHSNETPLHLLIRCLPCKFFFPV